jgi:predicted DNA repair protein MutK
MSCFKTRGDKQEVFLMSGLLALLDDVAAIAKVAAASVDDIAAAAVKAGSKTAGIVIDDAAVTPKYVHGLDASRELPAIWRITLGSLKNKLLFLLPLALLLSNFLPGAITPLLMLGGAYLCFEGAEKIFHLLFPHTIEEVDADFETRDPAHLEEERIAGAIKTDFILSAEIMTITLAAIPESGFWIEAVTLALVGVVITLVVYGTVALIVKMDDVGLHLARTARFAVTRKFGLGLVKFMPVFMSVLSSVGTAAMLWVGGSIITHGFDVLGWPWIYGQIHHLAEAANHATAGVAAGAAGLVEWAVAAGMNGVFGLALGFVLIPLVTKLIGPAIAAVTGKKPH